MASNRYEPLHEVLSKLVAWIKKEQMGWHEKSVSFQTSYMRTLKSWDFQRNVPVTAVDEFTLVIKWDQGKISKCLLVH